MNIKTLLVALCLCTATSISAQSEATNRNKSYNNFSIGYHQTTFSGDGGQTSDGENGVIHGMSVGFLHGKCVSDATPVFLEIGARVTWGTYTDKVEQLGIKDKTTKISFGIPLNVGLKLGNEVSFQPYTGVNIACNLLGKDKITGDNGTSVEVNWFDSYDLQNKLGLEYQQTDEAKWNRLQCGWQIGARISFGPTILGVEYGIDLTKLAKTIDTSHLTISAGCIF